jgi:transcriptional regulator with PAS, ATPase and Fis domain
MELDFRKNPAILSNMLDVMADGVFTVDANGHIVRLSNACENMKVFGKKMGSNRVVGLREPHYMYLFGLRNIAQSGVDKMVDRKSVV